MSSSCLELLMVISALLMPSCDSWCSDSWILRDCIVGRSGWTETDETRALRLREAP